MNLREFLAAILFIVTVLSLSILNAHIYQKVHPEFNSSLIRTK